MLNFLLLVLVRWLRRYDIIKRKILELIDIFLG